MTLKNSLFKEYHPFYKMGGGSTLNQLPKMRQRSTVPLFQKVPKSVVCDHPGHLCLSPTLPEAVRKTTREKPFPSPAPSSKPLHWVMFKKHALGSTLQPYSVLYLLVWKSSSGSLEPIYYSWSPKVLYKE